MRHEKAGLLLELARRLAASAEGLTLDEMAAAVGVGRRTVERMRDMATHYTGFMTLVGLLALLLQAPAPALGIIAGLWLWFAKAFWLYREDVGLGGRNRSAGRIGDYTPDEMQVRLRRIWR